MFMQNAHAFRPADRIALTALGLTLSPAAPAAGLLGDSLVETGRGWRRATEVGPGDRVQTWDGGLVAVTKVTRSRLPDGLGGEMILIPGGAFGACCDLWLTTEQEVLIASPVAEAVFDSCGAFVAAADLVGHCGVRRGRPARGADIVSLRLASDEAIFVNSGALIRAAGGACTDWLPALTGVQAHDYLTLVGLGASTTADLARAA